MTLVVYAAVYAGTAVFAVACILRAIRYARLPVHLRWEIYPVPHESPERVRHGGSYFENADWRTRARKGHLAGDLRFMIPEMVFLRGLWESNRRLWYRSFPFHFGLYLLGAALVLLAVTACATTQSLVPVPVSLVDLARTVYRLTGAAGWVLAFFGAAALLHRRLTDPVLRIYSAPADVVNPALFVITLGLVAVGYLTAGPAFPGALQFTRDLARLDASLDMPPTLGGGLLLASALLAYIPMTHMSHFIAKYFTYHKVRWDDLPAAGNVRLEHRIAACLAMRPTWAAKHVGADGTKTWAQIAMAGPGEETAK